MSACNVFPPVVSAAFRMLCCLNAEGRHRQSYSVYTKKIMTETNTQRQLRLELQEPIDKCFHFPTCAHSLDSFSGAATYYNYFKQRGGWPAVACTSCGPLPTEHCHPLRQRDPCRPPPPSTLSRVEYPYLSLCAESNIHISIRPSVNSRLRMNHRGLVSWQKLSFGIGPTNRPGRRGGDTRTGGGMVKEYDERKAAGGAE